METETGAVRVKGGSIRSKLVFVRETFGREAEARIQDLLADNGFRVILEASWYDYELFDAVLQTIARDHFGGDLAKLRDVGHFSARFALNTTYESFLRAKNILGFLRLLPRLHGRYYDRGRLSVHQKAPNRVEILLSGQPFYYESDMQVAAGFYTGSAEVMDCRQVSCEMQRKSQQTLFHLRWS